MSEISKQPQWWEREPTPDVPDSKEGSGAAPCCPECGTWLAITLTDECEYNCDSCKHRWRDNKER